MNNISLQDNQTLEAILNEYQKQLALCLKEIKQVIHLLDSPLLVSGKETQLSEKVALANRIINKTTQRLENLKQHSQLLEGKAHLTELENYGDIRELLSYQLEKVKQKTEQWKYSA